MRHGKTQVPNQWCQPSPSLRLSRGFVQPADSGTELCVPTVEVPVCAIMAPIRPRVWSTAGRWAREKFAAEEEAIVT
jgi:hypothetical protein